jgi:hypothetical protein
VLPLFTLYYALSLLLRGLGLLTFVDSPYLRELGDMRTERYRELVGWAFFVSAAGLLSLYAGFHSRLALRLGGTAARRAPLLTAKWNAARLTPVVAGLILIGLAAATARVKGPAGFLAAASNPMRMNTEDAVGYWWLIAATEFAIVGFHVSFAKGDSGECSPSSSCPDLPALALPTSSCARCPSGAWWCRSRCSARCSRSSTRTARWA